MNAQATKEAAQIVTSAALEQTAKKCGLTARQVLEQFAEDAQSGEFGESSRLFLAYIKTGADFVKSDDCYNTLRLAA